MVSLLHIDPLPGETLERRLTTIFVADLAGYSRLMAHDEEGTHRRVVALFRDVLEPAIEAHGGTLIKKTGDGVLAVFASVVEAVRCAIEVQRGAVERNAGSLSDDVIALRIGINLGDVIIEADDIYGDGVNIAARLEGLADHGGIVVSRSVRDHVRDRLKLDFDDLGEQIIKNIPRPVRAFRVRIENQDKSRQHKRGHERLRRLAASFALAAALLLGSATWWFLNPDLRFPVVTPAAPERPARLSIVVLPFVNLGADPQQDYFADGITQSLTTDLSRALPGSFVVARGTAFTYKDKEVEPVQVGRDLGVRYLLEGSVLTAGDRLRVNARLIETGPANEVWAERFDSQREDVLEIQDQIVARLSRTVGLQLIDIAARRSERERPHDPTAIDLVMRGQAIANRPATSDTMIAARALFQQAVEHDPDNVDALAGVAGTYVYEVLNSYYETGREQRLREARALVQRALALDPRHIVALKIQSAILRAGGQFEDAIAASETVIAENPGEPWSYKEIGLNELYLGRFQEALRWFAKADRIGPRDPSRWIWLGAMGRVQFFLGHNHEAIRLLRLSANANPNDVRAYALLAAVYASAGRHEEAVAALESCLRLRPDMTINRFFADWSVPLPATSPDYLREHERFREGLRLAGMPQD